MPRDIETTHDQYLETSDAQTLADQIVQALQAALDGTDARVVVIPSLTINVNCASGNGRISSPELDRREP